MNFQDKSIQCSDCGASFAFTSTEQEYFASRGFTNEPKRCLPCRQARKSERGGYSGSQRGMFPVVCAQCGKDTQVPFKPREGNPVYCSECYSKIRPSR